MTYSFSVQRRDCVLYTEERVFSPHRIPRLGKYTGIPCPESLRNERDIRDIRDIRGSRGTGGIRDITGCPENNLKHQSTPFPKKVGVNLCLENNLKNQSTPFQQKNVRE